MLAVLLIESRGNVDKHRSRGDVDEASSKEVLVHYVALKTFLLQGRIHDGGNRAIEIFVVVHLSACDAQEAILIREIEA